MKTCSTCKKEKNETEFYKAQNTKDGLHNACKKCCKESAKKSHAEKVVTREGNGLCIYCGKPYDGEKSRCQDCLDRASGHVKTQWKKRISNGVCGYCGKRKLFNDYSCEFCMHNYHREKENNPEKMILRHIKSTAKKRGLDFNLDISDIKIPKVCPLLEIPIEIGWKNKKDNSPSVDRIDSRIGYVKGNVWIISDKANRMKNDATLEEIILLAENAKKFISKN